MAFIKRKEKWAFILWPDLGVEFNSPQKTHLSVTQWVTQWVTLPGMGLGSTAHYLYLLPSLETRFWILLGERDSHLARDIKSG